MDPSVSIPVPSRLMVEADEAATPDDVALDEFLPYPEIWGLSSWSAPRKVPATRRLASASPVNRPPSSGLLCGGSGPS